MNSAAPILDARELGEVIVGCAAPAPDETNIGRVVALRLGIGHHVPAWSVMRNCASGMQALDSALMSIQAGRYDLALAGGVDALSRAPLLLSADMARWMGRWSRAHTLRERAQVLQGVRPHHLKPVIGLVEGLTDPVTGLSMGQTAENLAHQFGITRNQMDEYAARSHALVRRARERHQFDDELVPLTDPQGNVYEHDDGVRDDSTPGKLAQLKPVLDRPYGNITAGNSSQVSDGPACCCWLRLARSSVTASTAGADSDVLRIDRPSWAWAPCMPPAPFCSATVGLNDIDVWEINEAFAAQVLACRQAWNDDTWCQTHLGNGALGELDMDKLNITGGAIAIGHPVGASGARIVLRALHLLKERQEKIAMAAICIGGGQGGAMLLESFGGAQEP